MSEQLDVEDLVAAWNLAIKAAYKLAYGARLAELRDRRPSFLDPRGLHPYSVEVGRIYALQELLPELRGMEFDPVLVRAQAKLEAEFDWAKEVVDEWTSQGAPNGPKDLT